MTNYDKIVRSFYAGDNVSEEHIEKVKDALRDHIQEQVAPINAKLEAISEKLRDIYKANVEYDVTPILTDLPTNVEYDATPLLTDLPTIVICFICNAQYFCITHCFNVEELLQIPVELIVHRLVSSIDESILKMYKK